MIIQIKSEKKLKNYLHRYIEDQGIKVEVDKSLKSDEYIGIKVDDYYNGLHIGDPPKAVDFIVVVDCACESYALFIIEFKNVSNSHHIVIKDIQDKFTTTINDFMKDRFKDIFLKDKYKYKDIKLYLVSDAYGAKGKFKNHQEYRRYLEKINKKDSLKVDFNLSSKIYKFRNKLLTIKYDIPPNPVIKKIV